MCYYNSENRYKCNMTSKCKKLKLIAIDEQNYETLRMLGHTSDSFNDVLTKVLQNQKALTVEAQITT